jgi:hypothetical protein
MTPPFTTRHSLSAAEKGHALPIRRIVTGGAVARELSFVPYASRRLDFAETRRLDEWWASSRTLRS